MRFFYAFRILLIICGLVATSQGFSLPSLFDDMKKNYDNDEAVQFLGNNIEIEINETSSGFSPDDDILFQLYTPNNPNAPQIIQFDNESTLLESNFNNTFPTRIVIHGWRPNAQFIPMFIEAYFEKGNHTVNLIIVNWLKGAETMLYNVARGRVKMIANRITKLLEFLFVTIGMEYSQLTVIGHSLGAHIAGIVGKMIKNGKISKIVGLDPALPFFSFNDTKNRLAHSDANYVEVIHTSSGRLSFTQPIGTIDFYPNYISNDANWINGGQSQPGCGWDPMARCSHRRSWELYVESIYNPEFVAFECDSFYNLKNGLCKDDNLTEVLLMGGEPGNVKLVKGIFFLYTSEKSPFALGQNGVAKFSHAASKTGTFWNGLFGSNGNNEKSEVAQFFDRQFNRLTNWKNKFVNEIKK